MSQQQVLSSIGRSALPDTSPSQPFGRGRRRHLFGGNWFHSAALKQSLFVYVTDINGAGGLYSSIIHLRRHLVLGTLRLLRCLPGQRISFLIWWVDGLHRSAFHQLRRDCWHYSCFVDCLALQCCHGAAMVLFRKWHRLPCCAGGKVDERANDPRRHVSLPGTRWINGWECGHASRQTKWRVPYILISYLHLFAISFPPPQPFPSTLGRTNQSMPKLDATDPNLCAEVGLDPSGISNPHPLYGAQCPVYLGLSRKFVGPWAWLLSASVLKCLTAGEGKGTGEHAPSTTLRRRFGQRRRRQASLHGKQLQFFYCSTDELHVGMFSMLRAQVIMGSYALANLICVAMGLWQQRGLAPMLGGKTVPYKRRVLCPPLMIQARGVRQPVIRFARVQPRATCSLLHSSEQPFSISHGLLVAHILSSTLDSIAACGFVVGVRGGGRGGHKIMSSDRTRGLSFQIRLLIVGVLYVRSGQPHQHRDWSAEQSESSKLAIVAISANLIAGHA